MHFDGTFTVAKTTTGRLFIWYVITVHLIWGMSLLLPIPDPRTATMGPLLLAYGRYGAAAALMLTALPSMFALLFVHNRPMLRFALAMPQQLLVIQSALGALNSIIAGTYFDGTVVTSSHIFVDQLPVLMVAMFHTLAIIITALQSDGPRR